MMRERRTTDRVPVDLPAILFPRFLDRRNSEPLPCHIRSISLLGIFLALPPPLPDGDFFHLQCHLPGEEEALEVLVQKLWSADLSTRISKDGQVGFGARFEVLSRRNMRRIRRLIERVGAALDAPS